MTNAADNPPAAKNRHRWWQFGLRSLLLLVLLVAVALFVCREYLKPYWRQQQTVALVEKLGGSCQTAEAGRWWLRLVGSTHNVTQVNVADCDQPDAYLAAVAELPAIELLIVGGSAFTDEHARRLHRLRSLRGLILDCTSISDEALAELRAALGDTVIYRSQRRAVAALSDKATLELQTGGAAASPLGQLAAEWFQQVKTISATTTFGDAEAVHLSKLDRLQDLWLYSSQITDAGLENLKGLGQLRHLALSNTQVTDAGMNSLKGLGQLQMLWLEYTKVTAAGLEHLKVMSQLRAIYLRGTGITAAEVAKLRMALPNCRIEGLGE